MGKLYYESKYGSGYLAHSDKKDHKYIYKKLVNGKWRYYYDDPKKTKEYGTYKDNEGNTIHIKKGDDLTSETTKRTTPGIEGVRKPKSVTTYKVGKADQAMKKAGDAISGLFTTKVTSTNPHTGEKTTRVTKQGTIDKAIEKGKQKVKEILSKPLIRDSFKTESRGSATMLPMRKKKKQ